MSTFDAQKYKETTKQQWQDVAPAWHRWGPTLHRWLGGATDVMLDMAKVEAGCAVLDIAAGAGEQTITAAKRVGPSGRVLATDIAPKILEYALAEAQAAGLTNVEVQTLDGENIDLPADTFDVVISRVGLIYFPDQKRALAGMRRVLKPGGRVGAIVYSTPDKNAFFSTPVSIIRRRASLPAPQAGQPGPFSLGAPGALAAAFTDAGFKDVESVVVSAPLRLADTAECMRFERESFGALHQMLSALDDDAKDAAWAEIHEALSQFEKPGVGFEGPCEMVVAVGVK